MTYIWPFAPHPGFVRGSTCYQCGEALSKCTVGMPHGVHPDWLLFIAINGPDPFGTQRAAECEALPDRLRP